MDEGTTGMTSTGDGEPGGKDGAPPESAAQLEQDIEQIRNHMSDVAGELDRRRHRVMDIRGRLRRRAKPIAIGAAAVAALGIGIWWWRSRARRPIPRRILGLLPERVASGEWFADVRARVAQAIQPTPPARPVRTAVVKISSAGLAAAASVMGKRLAGQFATGKARGTPDASARPVTAR